jgi:hypothetical protein
MRWYIQFAVCEGFRNGPKESEELLVKQREREERQSGFNIGGELSGMQNRSSSTRVRAGRGSAPANPFAALSKGKENSAEKQTQTRFNPFKK